MSKVAGKCETTSPSVAGSGGFTIGAATDRQVRAKKKRRGACHYSERECACRGEHSNTNAHVGRCPYPGTAVADLALEKKCRAKPTAAVERDSRVGASTATQMCKQMGPMPDSSAFSMKIQLRTILTIRTTNNQTTSCRWLKILLY